ALAIALIFVPYASIVTYPCNLFVTLVHESSHALAALATRTRLSLARRTRLSGRTMQMSIGLAFANRVSQTILQQRRCFRWADSVATASPSPRMLYNLANDRCELRNLAA